MSKEYEKQPRLRRPPRLRNPPRFENKDYYDDEYILSGAQYPDTNNLSFNSQRRIGQGVGGSSGMNYAGGGGFSAMMIFTMLAVIVISIVAGVALGFSIYQFYWIKSVQSDVDSNDKDIAKLNMTIIYVNESTGDDNNPGTQAKPLLTIREAARRARRISNPEVIFDTGEYDWDFLSNKEDLVLFENGWFDGALVRGVPTILHSGVTWTTLTTGAFNVNRTVSGLNVVLTPGSLTGTFVDFPSDEGSSAFFGYRVILNNTADSITFTGEGISASYTFLNVFNTSVRFNIPDLPPTMPIGGSSLSTYQQIEFFVMDGMLTSGFMTQAYSMAGCRITPSEPDGSSMRASRSSRFHAVLFVDLREISIVRGGSNTEFSSCWIRRTNSTDPGTEGDFNSGSVTMNGVTWETTREIRISDALAEITESAFLGDTKMRFEAVFGNMNNVEIAVSRAGVRISEASAFTIENIFIHNDQPESNANLINLDSGSLVSFVGPDIHLMFGEGDSGQYFLNTDRSTFTMQSVTLVLDGSATTLFNIETSNANLQDFTLTLNASSVEVPTNIVPAVDISSSNLNIESVNWSFENINSAIRITTGSQVDILSSTINLNGGQSRDLLITASSMVTFDSTSVITSNCTNSADGCIKLTESSHMYATGDYNLTASSGVCVKIDSLSTLNIGPSAIFGFNCSEHEFEILDESKVFADSSATITLDQYSVNDTVLGGESNGTTFYFGTPDVRYTDGTEGAGIHGCSIRVSA